MKLFIRAELKIYVKNIINYVHDIHTYMHKDEQAFENISMAPYWAHTYDFFLTFLDLSL